MKSRRILSVLLVLALVLSAMPAGFAYGSATGAWCYQHQFDPGWVKAPTCTENGFTQYMCSVCGAFEARDEVPALGHDMGPWYTSETDAGGNPTEQRSDCQRTGCTYYETRPVSTVVSNTAVGTGTASAGEDENYLTVTAALTAIPARGFFVEGEFAPIQITVTAHGDFSSIFSWGFFGPLKDGESLSDTVDHLIFPDDCASGKKIVESYAEGICEAYGDMHTALSDPVYIPCGVIEDSSECLTLGVIPTSIPDNGSYYTPGEVVTYVHYVTDAGEDLFAGEFVMNQTSPEAKSYGSLWEVSESHTVTEKDAAAGYFLICGELIYTTGDLEPGYTSSHWEIPCGWENQYDVSVSKTVISTPANGAFYVPGEWVTYRIDVANTGKKPEGVWISDDMLFPSFTQSLNPGEGFSCFGSYQVTEVDALKGFLDNTVRVQVNWDGDNLDRYAYVTVPTGHGDLEESLSLYKMLNTGCVPANGVRFQEGEMLYYTIVVTNTGKVPLENVTVYDDRDTGFMWNVGFLAPGQIVEIPFSSPVTAEDCLAYVALNTAAATWQNSEEPGSVTSNTVAVPAGNYLSVLCGGDGFRPCTRTALVAGEGAWQYRQDYCAAHDAVHQQAKERIAEGAWAEAADLWRDAVEQLYADWLAAVQGERLTAAEADRDAFYAMLDAMEKAVDNPELLARTLEGKCTELCWELYSDPTEENPAGLNAELPVFAPVRADLCRYGWEDNTITQVCCETHNERLNRMLNSAELSPERLEQLRWSYFLCGGKTLLKGLWNEVGKAIGEEARQNALTASAAQTAYLEAHARTLTLYRDLDTAALEEASVRALNNMITLLCSTR